MHCGSCGFALAPDDRVCIACGAQIGGRARVSVESGATPFAVEARKPRSGCRCGAAARSVGAGGICAVCGAGRSPREDMFIEPGHGLALRTHMGRRHWPNEDYGAVDFEMTESGCYRWLIVSDGVSSSEQADRASEVACISASASLHQSVRSQIPARDAVQRAIVAAQNSVLEIPYTGKKREPPEATIVVALIAQETATIGWIGDSRVYAILRGPHGMAANLLTRDHSYANQLFDSGKVFLEEAMQLPNSHAITRSLGILDQGEQLEPGISQVSLRGAFYLLACTDGLWNYIHPIYYHPAVLLSQIAANGPDDPGLLASRLVDHANECGGRDNITVAVAMLQGAENERQQ